MARFDVRATDNFIEEVACIEQDRIIARLQMLAESLCGNPSMGAPCEDEYLTALYGENLYKYIVAAYELLYRFDGTTIDLLGITLVPPER